jgi:uncharacterized protein
MEKRPLALITGASSGIGRALTRQLCAEGYDAIAVGRDLKALAGLKAECESRFAISLSVYSVDLSDSGQLEAFVRELKLRGTTPDLLVNNAAFGVYGSFETASREKEGELIALQTLALIRLTKWCLPAMVEKGFGEILNVASLYAVTPVPGQSVYAALKSFVFSFSETLHFECREKGIHVTVVCPGLTSTNFRRDLTAPSGGGMPPESVAKSALNALHRNQRVVVPGLINKVLWILLKFLPREVSVAALRFVNARREVGDRN